MIGRAIFGNPWVMNKKIKSSEISMEKKLKVLAEHSALFQKLLGGHKSFDLMKKHFKAYVSGWPGAKELRVSLMQTKNASEVKKIVGKYLKKKSAGLK
jgi:tRNA-dihydrouridine synthase